VNTVANAKYSNPRALERKIRYESVKCILDDVTFQLHEKVNFI